MRGGDEPFWAVASSEVLRRVDAAPNGLSDAEAAARLRRYGANLVDGERRWAVAAEVAGYVANPLVLVLLLASVTSAFLSQVVSAVVIAVMLVLSIGLNFVQGYRSHLAARRLREQVAHNASVVRDGATREVPARTLVPGDVIHLAAGDLVPADARLLSAKDLFLNEAALTGESLPSEKHAEPEGTPSRDVSAARGAVFAGTSVVSGIGTGLVVHTGPATQFGRIAAHLTARPPETEFERGTRRFGFLILELVVFLVLFVFFVNALFRRDPLQSFLFAIALAVGLTPELLPMIVSVTLASGAVRMAKRQVIVKRLAAIENFGSMDILCSDKTGTLTRGEIAIARHLDVQEREDESVIRLAALNSAFQTGLRSPMDDAIVRHVHPDVARHHLIDEIPFDFVRRRVSVVVEDGGARLLIAKGAPEAVLPVCSHVMRDGVARRFEGDERRAAEALFARLSAGGYRVLAVASRPAPPAAAYGVADERDLVLAGFATFLDPPREGAAETLAALRRDGVEVKILTGDNPLVTERICRDVGLTAGTIVLGDEIDQMTDPALAAVAQRTTVFARITPVQKTRIVRALRAHGHVVGCLGDGINDAPALYAADVGISVHNAVEVAREAADIILLDRDLSVLHEGVVEGRRSFGNIMKYVLMGTSSNFGNMISMALASLVLPFLPMLPLQILVNNFLYDVSQIAIPSDAVDQASLVKPRRWNVAFIRRYMLLVGPISSLFDFLTFAVMLGVFHAGEALFHSGWFVESLATQTLVIFVIRTMARPWRSRPSPALAAGVLSAAGIGVALPFTRVGGWLDLVPLPPALLLFLLAMTLAYLACVELAKQWMQARQPA
ncbi:MAG: magnesium-translocating P-type ATPase [Deltaproteobacteria bacterium]|nr:magnesium-translocating P-type ATPase [Deltaproteobacteria bacterium]